MKKKIQSNKMGLTYRRKQSIVDITCDGKIVLESGEELKPYSSCGYLRVGNHDKYFYVHRLVAEIYVPNPDKKPFVNHKNGIKTDNRSENLEWVTAKENVRHAFKNKLMGICKGESKPSNKLTEKQVVQIRKEYIYWKNSLPKLSIKYGVAQSTISDIIKRKKWKHV